MKRGTQLKMKGTAGWGGARRGAGRPRTSDRVAQTTRGNIRAAHPVHVTMKLNPLGLSLRTKRSFDAFTRSARGARARGVRVTHFALMGNHLHMIVEADSGAALARGMRSFGGRLGKALRGFAGGRGAVFRDRFHAHVLRTPTEYRRALAYVLLNHARHAGRAPYADAYSSARHFDGWRDLVAPGLARSFERRRSAEPSPPVAAARSWLGRVGWRRARGVA